MTEQLKTLYSVTGDIKDINTLLVPRAKQMSPSGDMPEDFEEGQWWLKELDAMAKDGTPDQKRAVAVVRNLMATAKAQPTQAEAVHSYVLELPDGDARQAKVCWSDRNEANGEIRHHLCISVVAAPQQAEAALQWCQDCGEGYVNFCRVKSNNCKMKPKVS